MATFLTNFNNFLSRVERADALRLVYPKFTSDGLSTLDSIGESDKNKVWTFIFQVISELASGKDTIDGFFVQYDHLTLAAQRYIAKQNLPFIPTINIQGDYRVVTSQLNSYSDMPSSLVPFIGLSYSTLSRSNLAYREAISMLDALHESGKGFITIDSPRVAGRGVLDPDVSALHYSSFIVADLVAERIYTGGGGVPNIRLFDKGDLAVPQLGTANSADNHTGEDGFLQDDPKLQTLLKDMFHGTISERESSRATYLSRIHENIVTGQEYENMRRSIVDSELLHYRTEKHRINALLQTERR